MTDIAVLSYVSIPSMRTGIQSRTWGAWNLKALTPRAATRLRLHQCHKETRCSQEGRNAFFAFRWQNLKKASWKKSWFLTIRSTDMFFLSVNLFKLSTATAAPWKPIISRANNSRGSHVQEEDPARIFCRRTSREMLRSGSMLLKIHVKSIDIP